MAEIQQKGILFYIKRIFGLILLLALAAVFLFSAWSKLMAFEPFQWTFMDLGISSMTVAGIIAYVFIGLEFMIGLFLIGHIYQKQVSYPATLILLAAFTGSLILLIIQQGNTGNCGCFGDWIYMKPLDAIWKNLAMMAAVVILMFIYPIKPYRNQEWIAVVAGMAALVVPFVISPPNFGNEPSKANREINMDALYIPGIQQPEIDLRKGKHVVAFMSLTCPHCRKAAYLMHILERQHPELPVYIILSGKQENYESFFEESKAQNVPHILFGDMDEFKEMAGDYVPAIYWIDNSVVEREANYNQLDPAIIKKWLKE